MVAKRVADEVDSEVPDELNEPGLRKKDQQTQGSAEGKKTPEAMDSLEDFAPVFGHPGTAPRRTSPEGSALFRSARC